MSDYMFMLENHLSADQRRAVAEVQAAAALAHVNLYLTGGALRDMLAGFPIRDLDFRVEGNALKVAKLLAQSKAAEIVATDATRKSVDLRFGTGVTAEISMARQERFARPGGKPQVAAASIHEDLRGRDFTINSIALSLNANSKGLLIDPVNGLSDIERKELRANHNYVFYDDPARLLRLVRFRVRLGYTVEERTQMQFDNAREAGMLARIPTAALTAELHAYADEPNVAELLEALEREKLLALFSPALAGPKLNLAAFHKLQKARQMMPFGLPVPSRNLPLFLHLLCEKLSAKERAALAKTAGLSQSDLNSEAKLVAAAKKAERELKNPRLNKPSLVYTAASAIPGEVLLYLLLYSGQRVVQDRIKNYFQKYLLTAAEVTDKEVEASGAAPGSPKFAKAKQALVLQRLDARPKKTPPPEPPPPPPPPPSPFGRRA
jgi:tRNA nucleotidyltransferase/poly(A) polymerase